LTIGRRDAIMEAVTTRETAHALLDRYPDEEFDDIVAFLACRRAADGTDLSAKGILARHGERPLTPQELEQFMAEYGPHMGPTDNEG
jgi:hypothetical protein